MKTAKWLFYINLLPSILGVVMVVVMPIFTFSGHFTYMNLFRSLLFIAGVFCEWVYLKIFRPFEYFTEKTGWIYSIILNGVFILYYIINNLSKDYLTWPLIIAVYPLGFLIASCYALQKYRNIEREIGRHPEVLEG